MRYLTAIRCILFLWRYANFLPEAQERAAGAPLTPGPRACPLSPHAGLPVPRPEQGSAAFTEGVPGGWPKALWKLFIHSSQGIYEEVTLIWVMEAHAHNPSILEGSGRISS